MTAVDVTFANGTLRLAGELHRPAGGQPWPAVVAIHPASGGERNDPFYDHLKTELPRHGIAALVFDRRGSGGSDGDFETASFDDLAGDVLAAVEYLRARPDVDGSRVGLHGTSQGGWIAPIAAARDPSIACIVAVSACGVTPAAQMDYGVAFHLQQAGYSQPVIDQAIALRQRVNDYFRGRATREDTAAALRPFEAEPWFEQAYIYPSKELPTDVTQSKWHFEMDYEPLAIWREVHHPTLFLFASQDEWVPVEASIANFKAATSHLPSATFQQIANTDHLMRNRSGAQTGHTSKEYLDTLIQWLISTLRPT